MKIRAYFSYFSYYSYFFNTNSNTNNDFLMPKNMDIFSLCNTNNADNTQNMIEFQELSSHLFHIPGNARLFFVGIAIPCISELSGFLGFKRVLWDAGEVFLVSKRRHSSWGILLDELTFFSNLSFELSPSTIIKINAEVKR